MDEKSQPRPHGMFHLLMHIGHLLEEHCRSGLSEYGLHHGQARVLMALDRAGGAGGAAEEGGVIQARLANGLGIAAPTLSIMLKKLVSQGLVERTADANDERVQRIALTPEGRLAVKQVRKVWGAAYKTIMDSLSGDETQLIHKQLLKIRNGLGGTSPEL